ncbi:MAG: DNA-processing protein DprA [Candidatus Paceibacterota bacterium]
MYSLSSLEKKDFPPALLEIPEPPTTLRFAGKLPDWERPFLCVVGSRQYTSYGKEACEYIISGLRGSNVVIISGLALGIDAVAHEAALKSGLTTIALPGSGLLPQMLYPKTNVALAKRILDAGGALLSEFPDKTQAAPYTFPQRNRLMAGLSRGVLVIEAQERSGTVITARLATEYNKDVFAVPASIFSKNAEAPHRLIKAGAIPATCAEDILLQWGLMEEGARSRKEIPNECNKEERILLALLETPLPKEELYERSGMNVTTVNVLLSSLEIKGLISESGGEVHRI